MEYGTYWNKGFVVHLWNVGASRNFEGLNYHAGLEYYWYDKKVVWVLAIFVSIHVIRSVLVICGTTVTNET